VVAFFDLCAQWVKRFPLEFVGPNSGIGSRLPSIVHMAPLPPAPFSLLPSILVFLPLPSLPPALPSSSRFPTMMPGSGVMSILSLTCRFPFLRWTFFFLVLIGTFTAPPFTFCSCSAYALFSPLLIDLRVPPFHWVLSPFFLGVFSTTIRPLDAEQWWSPGNGLACSPAHSSHLPSLSDISFLFGDSKQFAFPLFNFT